MCVQEVVVTQVKWRGGVVKVRATIIDESLTLALISLEHALSHLFLFLTITITLDVAVRSSQACQLGHMLVVFVVLGSSHLRAELRVHII